jgi:hypothetical protein
MRRVTRCDGRIKPRLEGGIVLVASQRRRWEPQLPFFERVVVSFELRTAQEIANSIAHTRAFSGTHRR